MVGLRLSGVVRSHIEHHDPANLRLHLAASVAAWFALTTALSQIPIPFGVPGLGANLGAAWVVFSSILWCAVDPVVAMAVLAATWGFVSIPAVPWGPHHGWLAGVILPLGIFLAAEGAAALSHVYHHEHATFLRGGPRLAAALAWVSTRAFGPFHFGLHALLRRGWRPRLAKELHDRERAWLTERSEVPWVNWCHTAACRAHHASVPETIEEMAEAVRDAHARGQRVRVVASGFSWSSLVPTDETLLFCERLNGVSVDASDPSRPRAWVEAGVTNRQLNRELARHGLCMPWNVVLENVRLAGLVTSGTHGSGRATATVGDLVEALEVIDSEGRLRVLSDETVGAEVMSAARLSLGLFGVIARIKLRVVPLHRVRQEDRRLPAAEVLNRLEETLQEHDSLELYWFPFQKDVWMRTVDRTDAPRTFRGHGLGFKTQNLVQNAWLVLFSRLVLLFAPALTPLLLRVGIEMLPFRTRVLSLPESHHYHHWIEMMRCGCMEVGFKVDAGAANVKRAWAATERLVSAYARRGLYPLNLTLNVRFTGASSALLTPAYGEGTTCYVEIMWRGRPKGWVEFTSELCKEWLSVPGALPHWSKEFEHVEGVVDAMRASLGARRERFLSALASTGVDPGRGFWNPLLRRVLLDEARS